MSNETEPTRNELDPPPLSAHNDEIMRAWLVGEESDDRELRVIFNAGFPGPGNDVERNAAMWGMVLADIARFVADGVADLAGADSGLALDLISRVFQSEMGDPTGDPQTSRVRGEQADS